MRGLLSALLGATAWLAASMAQAGPLTAATWTSLIQGNALTETLTTLNANGAATATHYSVGLSVPLFVVDQFNTTGAIPVHTSATLSGAQLVTGSASAAGATVGVGGKVTVKTAAHGKLSTLAVGQQTLVKVPLSVGVGKGANTFTDYFVVLGVLHYITVDFYGWTPHTLSFYGLTSSGAPLETPTVVAMGSFGLTPMGRRHGDAGVALAGDHHGPSRAAPRGEPRR